MVKKRRAVKARIEGYVRRRVLPALGLRGREFKLKVPKEGTRSIVLFLHVGEQRFVLRVEDRIGRALRTWVWTRHIMARKAPAPRLLFADLSPWTRLRLGYFILVEEFVDGRNLYEVEATPERLRSAGVALASFHAATRSSWGPLLPVGRRSGFFRVQQDRLTRRLDELVKILPALAVFGDPVARAWLDARAPELDTSFGYSLCHLRVSDTNVLFRADDTAVLIDIVTARYSHPGSDLERAVHRWCKNVPERRELFLDAYCGRFERFTRSMWERSRPYFHASFHLTQANRVAQRARKMERRADLEQPNRRAEYQELRHMVVSNLRDALTVFRGSGAPPPPSFLEQAEHALEQHAATIGDPPDETQLTGRTWASDTQASESESPDLSDTASGTPRSR